MKTNTLTLALLVASIALTVISAQAYQWSLAKTEITIAGVAFGNILANEVWDESMVGHAPFPTAEEQYIREAIGANRAGYYVAADVRLFVAVADRAYEIKYAEMIAKLNKAMTSTPTVVIAPTPFVTTVVVPATTESDRKAAIERAKVDAAQHIKNVQAAKAFKNGE